MKATDLQAGMKVMHDGELRYLKTKSYTMGNIIHATLRSEGGGLVQVQWTTNQEVQVP